MATWDIGDVVFPSPVGGPGSFAIPPGIGGTMWSPEETWAAFLRPYMGTPLGRWLAPRQKPYEQRFTGAAIYEPSLTWEEWLRRFSPELEYAYTSPFERGEQPSAFLGRSRRIG